MSVATTVVSTRSLLPSSSPMATAACTKSSLISFSVCGVSRVNARWKASCLGTDWALKSANCRSVSPSAIVKILHSHQNERAQHLLCRQPLATSIGSLEAAPQIAANGLDYLFMLIEEIGDRRERWFQNYSLPQQLPVGEAELRIGESRHGLTLRLFRRHLPLALQSLHVPRCGIVQ